MAVDIQEKILLRSRVLADVLVGIDSWQQGLPRHDPIDYFGEDVDRLRNKSWSSDSAFRTWRRNDEGHDHTREGE